MFYILIQHGLEVCTDQIFQAGPGPPPLVAFSAQTEREIKISALAQPDQKQNT